MGRQRLELVGKEHVGLGREGLQHQLCGVGVSVSGRVSPGLGARVVLGLG